MTMFDNNFPASSYYYSDQNLCGQHFDGLGHGYRGLMNQLEQQGFRQSYQCYYTKSAGCLVGTEDTVMAEDESRTESVNDEAGPSYSKDVVAAYPFSAAAAGVEFRAPPPPHFALTSTVVTPGAAVGYISAAPSYFLQQQQAGGSDMNWAIRPVMAIPAPGVSAPSSSASPFMYAPPLSGSRFAPRPGAFPLLYAGVGGVGAGGSSPSLEFRVIDPPRRPLSGIWFSLQASQNQAKEPFLPQISKSYLRIKDGSMTIRLVLKYLVNKLQLDNESEDEWILSRFGRTWYKHERGSNQRMGDYYIGIRKLGVAKMDEMVGERDSRTKGFLMWD
nr:E3 ubiquitin protein ligase drip2 [Ipomoea batatas]